MIRTDAQNRPVRTAAALIGVAGVLVLAGCGSSTSGGSTDAGTDTGTDSGASTGSYTDGEYTADGSYQTPETIEEISVSVTLADGVITAVEVTGDPQAPESVQYQGQFIGGIQAEVVGKSIDVINVSRVAGSSLTSGGFNDAIEQIKADAAA